MQQLKQGFSGELPQVMLADVLQFHGHNGFSGGISFKQDTEKGVIFFRDGNVVHAEQGKLQGIDAIYRMLLWKGGEFSCHPNLETLNSSVRMTLSHLLLECHRRLDENQDQEQSKPQQSKKAVHKSVRKILPIPGVNFAVLIDEQGKPLEDDSDGAARLSAQGEYFDKFAQQLGQLLGLAGCNVTVASGKAGHCLGFRSNNKTMVVGMPADADFRKVESAIRSTLSRK